MFKAQNLNVFLVSYDEGFGLMAESLVKLPSKNLDARFAEAENPVSGNNGDFSLLAEPSAASYGNSQPLAAIDWGTQLTSGTVNVYFAPAGYEIYDGNIGTWVTAESWNAYEKQQFQLAFEQIENVVQLDFNVVTNANDADFTLIMDLNDIGEDIAAYFYPPAYNDLSGTGVFAGQQWDRYAGGDLEAGGYGFATILHELLHGLGLAHPHDNGGSSSTMDGVWAAYGDYGAYDLNQGVYTAMTYNSGLWVGDVGKHTDIYNSLSGFEAGPMALDIAVLQAKYGANETFNNTDTTYELPTSNTSGTVWAAIWDTGGHDTIRHSSQGDANIDLRAATLENAPGGGGFLSAVDNVSGGFTIANGVTIEAAIGGTGNDVLSGNAAANRLNGNAGNDEILGRSGDDVLLGGSGRDELRGGRGQDVLYGGEANDALRGQREGDMLYGGAGADNAKGGGGNDTIYGESGDDYLTGGTRRDAIYGGDGNDRIIGNSFDDILDGGAGNDALNAGGENDTLNGGEGDDFLKGGSGSDTFIFDIGHGADRIDDFTLSEDILQLSVILAGGLSAEQIVENATALLSDTILIDFGNGDSIELSGHFDIETLADQISVV